MKRDFGRLHGESFDLLVIGGGIYGAWTALDASLRGLKVALVEKGDWASGTSSASSKLIHGGLRYLGQYRFGLVRKSLKERRLLLSIAPHMVRPLRFFIPVYRGASAGPLALEAGLTIYDLLAGGEGRLHPHESIRPGEAADRYSFIRDADLRRGFTYWDAQTDDFRLTLEVIKAAHMAGAAVVNYAQAVELLKRGGKAAGARINDVLTGGSTEVMASLVVNTAGPWAALMDGAEGLESRIRLTRGVHLVMPGLPTGDALLIMTSSDKRIFFMIPWYGRTLLGTTDTDYKGNPDDVRVEESDIDYLLREAGRVLKEGTWNRSSIIGCYAGLRALINEPGKPPSSVTREWAVTEPFKGMPASIGGKLTSAREDAALLVNKLMAALGRSWKGRPPTETFRLPSSPGDDYSAWHEKNSLKGGELGLDPETASFMLSRYGTGVSHIHSLIEGDPSLARRLTSGLPFCRAELLYSAGHEMATCLNDLLRRRIPLTILSGPDTSAYRDAAALAGPVMGWSGAEQEEQVRLVIEARNKCRT